MRADAASPRKILKTPQKLYGRETESALLKRAYARVCSHENNKPELVLISGESGAGKSYLVEQLLLKQQQNAYFVSGKFDQLQSRQPYSAVSCAFSTLYDQILASRDDVELIRHRIRDTVGSQVRVLTDVLPSLTPLFSNEQQQHACNTDEIPSMPRPEARNRFHYVFRKFVRALGSPQKPLVVFLDDVHWSDEASLDLISTIVSDNNSMSPSFLVIAAFRDNEVGPGHPLMIHLRQIEQRDVPVTRLQVKNLTKHAVSSLLADSLGFSVSETQSLADIVYQHTEGNAFFVIHFLNHLHSQDLLVFSHEAQAWLWDEEIIRSRNIPNDVVQLMATKIQTMEPQTQEILLMAAGIGTYFDYYTLKLIANELQVSHHELESILETSIEESMIVRKSKLGYGFAHDKIQQAAYSRIIDRPRLHLTIGRILTSSISSNASRGVGDNDNGDYDFDRVFFLGVDQLNLGSTCIQASDEQVILAARNLRAAKRAAKSAAFIQAVHYLKTGLLLLPKNSWNTNYDLTLQLQSLLAEMNYCNGSFDKASDIVDEVLAHATSLLDKLRVFSVSIKSLGAQSKVQEAIDVGFDVLAQLGELFPKNVGNLTIKSELMKTKMLLVGKTDKILSTLPKIESELKIAAMQILCSMLSLTYMCRPQFVPLIAFRMMQITLHHGCCNETAFAFSTYALILSGQLSDFKGGYRFAQLALALIENLDGAEEWFAHVYGVVYSCCTH